ncbi:hypothetical protein AVEN_130538-1 [Araneus ventricosus]|uniref:Uncharacterized protein n=1 Tax=Araneus ventricosus TaxID=182803 RepID=A0A4Y2J6K3_ARAVE|nr:hypothetical protein AVEN_130538-1 [Araneus ventricosus]
MVRGRLSQRLSARAGPDRARAGQGLNVGASYLQEPLCWFRTMAVVSLDRRWLTKSIRNQVPQKTRATRTESFSEEMHQMGRCHYSSWGIPCGILVLLTDELRCTCIMC